MVLLRRPLVLSVDLGGALALAGVLTAGALLVVQPGLESARSRPALRAAVRESAAQLERLSRRVPMLEQHLAALESSLLEQAEQPLADVGAFLGRIGASCAARGLELEQVQPVPAPRAAEFEQWDVQVRARGKFPALQGLLAELESWSPYLELIALTVQGPADGTDAPCELTVTTRIRYLTEWASRTGGRR